MQYALVASHCPRPPVHQGKAQRLPFPFGQCRERFFVTVPWQSHCGLPRCRELKEYLRRRQVNEDQRRMSNYKNLLGGDR